MDKTIHGRNTNAHHGATVGEKIRNGVPITRNFLSLNILLKNLLWGRLGGCRDHLQPTTGEKSIPKQYEKTSRPVNLRLFEPMAFLK